MNRHLRSLKSVGACIGLSKIGTNGGRARLLPSRKHASSIASGSAGASPSLFQHAVNGSTLTEVLVALMIMSVGIVSVATLFPLSVLRSIKASQLTNSTDLRYNAETLLDLQPQLIRSTAIVTTTAPYNVGIIDPLGYHKVGSKWFGNNKYNIPSADPTNPLIPRLHGGTDDDYIPGNGTAAQEASQLARANSLATLPDSWVQQHSGAYVPGSLLGAGTRLDVVGAAAAGLFVTPTSPVLRAVIFDVARQSSHVRTITQVTGNTLYWTEDLNGNGTLDPGEDSNGNFVLDDHPLPVGFTPGFVMIQQQDWRYTWLLTIRKDAANTADVDVVVSFSRRFDTGDDEVLYAAAFIAGSNQLTVTIPAGVKPNIKAGGFVFDAEAGHGRWYRIRAVGNLIATSLSLILESPSAQTSGFDNSTKTGRGKAMFPRAVVDVYPIGQKSYGP